MVVDGPSIGGYGPPMAVSVAKPRGCARARRTTAVAASPTLGAARRRRRDRGHGGHRGGGALAHRSLRADHGAGAPPAPRTGPTRGRCRRRRWSASRERRSVPPGHASPCRPGRPPRRCSSPAGRGASTLRSVEPRRSVARAHQCRHRALHDAPDDRASHGGHRVQRGRGPRLGRDRHQPRSQRRRRGEARRPRLERLRVGRGDR